MTGQCYKKKNQVSIHTRAELQSNKKPIYRSMLIERAQFFKQTTTTLIK